MVSEEENAALSLVGHLGVVTGGSAGIGRAVAFALAGAEAKVAVISRSETPLSETVNQIREQHGAEPWLTEIPLSP